MISVDKALAYPERLSVDKRPLVADLFLTRRCNNACPYCTYERYETRSGAYMDSGLFRRVADRLVGLGVKGIILTGGGEPTASPDLPNALHT